MNDWPYQARDLAIAHHIMRQMASQHKGILRFVEDYNVDETTDTVRFTLSAWVRAFIQAFRLLYPVNELCHILDKVLDETLKSLGILQQPEAKLFKNLVLLTITEEASDKTLH